MNLLWCGLLALVLRVDFTVLAMAREPLNGHIITTDADAKSNLANDSKYQQEYDRLTQSLESWMVMTTDPILETFRQRDLPTARESFMRQTMKKSARRRAGESKKQGGKRSMKKAKMNKKRGMASSW